VRGVAIVIAAVLLAVGIGVAVTGSSGLAAPVPLATDGLGYLNTTARHGVEWVQVRDDQGRLVGVFDIWVDNATCGGKATEPLLPCEIRYVPSFVRSGNVLYLTDAKQRSATFTIERAGLLQPTFQVESPYLLLRPATVQQLHVAVHELDAYLAYLRRSCPDLTSSAQRACAARVGR
jgi:hypothetical protein